MCAIAGAVGLPISQTVEKRMLHSMLRRGPDGNGVFQDNDCTLLHSRLAIIDPEGGRQPMSLSWAGEEYSICYNGEIYNTEEIREELKKLGHSFFGHSDTEVVLHGYAQWGEGVLSRLNGIFAFGIWAGKGKRLFLARDRIGVKPLFYTLHQGGILFASEIKTILEYPSVPRVLNRAGIGEIFLLGPGRIPDSGVLAGIKSMEPGWCGCFEEGKWHQWAYWKLKDREHTESFSETREHTAYLVEDAIRRQMVSDVPIGTFLSGGLDSSLITAVVGKEFEKRGKRLPTFSVDYQDNDRFFQPGKFQPNPDADFIGIMEEAVPCIPNHTVLTPAELFSTLGMATEARDLPGMADVDFSLLAFCKRIREKVKVALSGECADEIFGGYPWYRDPEVRNRNGFPWAQNSTERFSMLLPQWQMGLEGFAQQQYEDTLRNCDILPGISALETRMKQMVNLNLRWFMQTLLDRKDRMSMYWGLEVRVPFCDYRIVEYLYGVPWEMKDYRGREKGLLRYAMERWLPEEILWRKKSPYPKTFHPEYRKLTFDAMENLMKRDAPLWELISKERVQALMDGQMQWPWYGQLMREPQTIAFLLQTEYWLENYRIKIERN